jgi:catechol 2,3-dioxygenase-like lactoylglutathione lyase family enzyme
VGTASSPYSPNEATRRRDSRDPYLRIHHVTIFVRDHDRSLQFYVDQLGFNLVIDYRFGEQGRFVLIAPPDGTALLALLAPKPESEQYKLIGQAEQTVFVTEDVDAKFQAWHKRGVRFRHPPQPAT